MKKGSRTSFYSASSRTRSSGDSVDSRPDGLRDTPKNVFRSLVTFFIFAVPSFAHAQVIVSEVMYDPIGSDDKQEWIELYNAGDAAVDITKWTFSDGSSATKHGLNVPPKNGGIGSLVMAPGGYLVIADDAATFGAAFPAIANVTDSTMSLPDPNAGVSVTVTLYDDQKNVADTFVYVGGTNADNKGDSAQRAGSLVIPAVTTPGAGNAQVADTTTYQSTGDVATTFSQTSAQTAAQAPVPSYVPPPLPTLFADGGADPVVIVGADSEFDGRAYTRSQDIVENVRYNWNFGDGSTGEGKAVTHHFVYPGRYAVVLTVAQDKNSASDRIIVAAEPAQLSFTVFADGSVEIGNRSGRDLDLSHWIVKSGGQQFMLPDDTSILAGGSMRIAQPTLRFWSNASTELQYPNGVLALHAGEVSPEAQSVAPVPSSPAPLIPSPAPKVVVRSSVTHAVVQETPDVPAADVAPAIDTAASSSQAAAAGGALPLNSPWLWSAVGLAAVGGGIGYLASRAKKNEWDIEEASDTV